MRRRQQKASDAAETIAAERKKTTLRLLQNERQVHDGQVDSLEGQVHGQREREVVVGDRMSADRQQRKVQVALVDGADVALTLIDVTGRAHLVENAAAVQRSGIDRFHGAAVADDEQVRLAVVPKIRADKLIAHYAEEDAAVVDIIRR